MHSTDCVLGHGGSVTATDIGWGLAMNLAKGNHLLIQNIYGPIFETQITHCPVCGTPVFPETRKEATPK